MVTGQDSLAIEKTFMKDEKNHGSWKKTRIGKSSFFAGFSVGSIPSLLQTNIDKASNCHIERRKKKREGRETAVVTVLIRCGCGTGTIGTTAQKEWTIRG